MSLAGKSGSGSGKSQGQGQGSGRFQEIRFEKTRGMEEHHQEDDDDEEMDIGDERIQVTTVPEIFTTAQQRNQRSSGAPGGINQTSRDFYVYGFWSLPMVALLFGVDVCLQPNISVGVALVMLILLLRTRGVVSETSEAGREYRVGWKLLTTWTMVLLASAVACSVSFLHPRPWEGRVSCVPESATWSPTSAPTAGNSSGTGTG